MSLYDLTSSLSNFENGDSFIVLKDALDGSARVMATSLEERVNVGSQEKIWDGIYRLWRTLTQRCLDALQPAQSDLDLLFSLARFTRNLVAGSPANQESAFQVEPQLRSLIHCLTSFLMLQVPTLLPTTRLLTQTLSNIITDNNELSSSLWTTYMAIPGDGNILMCVRRPRCRNVVTSIEHSPEDRRLLAVDDINTLMTCFILMLNATRASPNACRILVESKAGQRISIKLLNRMAVLVDAPDETPEAAACDIAYQILRPVFDLGLGVTLYNAFSIDGEPMLPHQRTLLKLMDGYFQNPTAAIHTNYTKCVPTLYMTLIIEAFYSIKRSLASDPVLPEPALPSLGEGVVLAAQCSQALLLRESDSPWDERLTLKCMLSGHAGELGSVELTVETLRSLALLLPRIQFGKAVASPMANPRVTSDDVLDPTAFPYVKRDLLRLLGTLAYENRLVQDRMRVCGGIETVMNHCVVDERNPYLREHAIFALRNLLQDNPENQRAVHEMEPLQGFDAEGVLRDLPQAE